MIKSEIKKQRKKQIKDFKRKRQEYLLKNPPKRRATSLTEQQIADVHVPMLRRADIANRAPTPGDYDRLLREERIRILRDVYGIEV